MNEISKERKFLHDIATPIAGLKLTINRIYKSMHTGEPKMSNEQIVDRLGKCSEMIKQLEDLHADFKTKIT